VLTLCQAGSARGHASGDAIVRAEPFDAIELDLLPIWGAQRE
jgi:hypothetical protein